MTGLGATGMWRSRKAASGSSTAGGWPDETRSVSSMNSGTSAGSNWLPLQQQQLVDRLVVRSGAPVRPAERDRVVGVGDGHDPGAERDLLAGQAVRVAGAVPALVVVPDDRREQLRRLERLADAPADLRGARACAPAPRRPGRPPC